MMTGVRLASGLAVLFLLGAACSSFSAEDTPTPGAGTDGGTDGGGSDSATTPETGSVDAGVDDANVSSDGCAGMGITQKLVAYWRFENNLDDSTCNHHVLTPTTDCDAGIKYGVTKLGAAFDPGASLCAFTASNMAFKPAGDFTVAVWVTRIVTGNAIDNAVHFSMLGNSQVILGAWQDGPGFALPLHPYLGLYNGGTVVGTVHDSNFDFRAAGSTNQPIHVIGFRRGVTIGVRVNGAETIAMIAAGAPLGSDGAYFVSRERDGYPWQGTIDEVTQWDRALTGAEMDALYNGGAGFVLP